MTGSQVVVVAAILLLWNCVHCDSDNPSSSSSFLALLPWEVRWYLLQLQAELKVTELTGFPVPMYRPDLGNQTAYWLISYNHHEYAILSAGQHTGDSMLLMQGGAPSPMTFLQQQALTLHNSTCDRYLLLTPSPDLDIGCDTPEGLRLTSAPLDSHVNLTAMWQDYTSQEQQDDGTEDFDDGTMLNLDVISASYPADFPMADMRECHIRSLGQSDGSDVSVETICKILGVCDEHGQVHSHRVTAYGEVYLHLEPRSENEGLRFTRDLHFQVVCHQLDNQVVSKGFAMEPSHRAKRSSSYTYYSIDDPQLMPDYNQFKRGSCQVGCGPVAWAQIFGYYDRRAHAGKGNPSGKALYRCGADGTSGNNSCVAPSRNDNRMEQYIGKLHDILRTFCLFGQGATTQRRMDDVAGFFRERVGTSGNIILKKRSFFLLRWIGTHSDSIRDSALGYLRKKWPVIVGFRISGVFSQHYAVMTRYRTRVVRKKKCFLWVFCRRRDTREYDMYVHMGWGGSSNGWRKAAMFMAAVATF